MLTRNHPFGNDAALLARLLNVTLDEAQTVIAKADVAREKGITEAEAE